MDLTRQLAHELKAPLLSLELRLRRLVEETSNGDLAQNCLDEVTTLKRLVTNLLELEPERLAPRALDLSPLLARVEQRYLPLASSRHVSLSIAPAPATVIADPHATERILGNLVDNAIKFSCPEGSVQVRARVRGGSHVEIEVRDEGIGMPSDATERIFEPFFRVDREVEGAGLGLAISKRLAEAQGGTLRCKSELDRGSSFTLTLPAES